MTHNARASYLVAAVALLPGTTVQLAAQEPKLRAVFRHEAWGDRYSDLPISVAFSSDGKVLASAGRWQIVLWEVATGKPRTILKDGSGFIQTVAFSGDSQTLASAAGATVRLWDVATGKPKATLASFGADTGLVKCLAFSGDGKLLASGGFGKAIAVWDVASQVAVQSKRDEQQRLAHEAMARKDKEKTNSERIAQLEKEITAADKPKVTLKGHRATVWSVAFSADGQLLASASEDRTVKLWDVASGKVRATLDAKAPVTSVAFSGDDKTLACGVNALESSRFLPVKLWDVTTGKEQASLKGQPPYGFAVHTVAFIRDGKAVVSATDGRFVSLWDVATGQPQGTLKKGWPGADVEGVPSGVAFRADGKLVAVGVGGKQARVYLWALPWTP